MVNAAVVPAEGFWAGKKVFLTGHTGFKGTWLSLWLQRLGAEVTGYALGPESTPSMFALTRAAHGMRSVIGDVRDAALLSAALEEAAPEVVFHLAAQPLVRQSYADPVATYSTNVMGTVHLLEAVRRTPAVRAVVVVTSDKCYENREWLWGYREDDALGGFDPYSNSKACAELVAACYRNSFFSLQQHGRHGVALATARAGNVIGGGDWSADRLIPDFLRAAGQGTALELRHPAAVRPWQHVLEPLAGYLCLARQMVEQGGAISGAWNFGPSDEDVRSVGDVIRQLAAAWPQPVDCRFAAATGGLHEARMLRLDSSKAHAVLGWRSRWTLSQALERITDWHAAHGRGLDMRQVTEDQIDSYCAAGR
ncbi:CDP-glucose 4,6-dehydratase [Paracidovorax cattleyae]|uniref:CDP-glucose 4,6-dehydratase n=1 Tax=Paracidovorax cattleyae TaxID=80868 RepID=A0A1H0TS63_9BURK|nr:CDP-glucose 4,6-dehydratase [Paracidovorax cattleyae]MBF9264631.1 CDP-glucose 4,6-dehydratase [Paracidovorax cattleyae]SDP56406.1 CDP-glucose 4,6-dehydratase [Paracidovorax cattleyae]